jgi:peptidoglycan/xylan/chitin deacetylase (PgdA/CDA1 family)
LETYRSTYFLKLHPQHIPVLMYHKVPEREQPDSKHRIFVTKDNFERHLRFFKKNRFTTLSFKELQEFRELKRPAASFPKKPLILTFDDGYVDNLENAAPLLRKYDMKATIFLLADPEVRSNYWDDDSGDPAADLMSLTQKRALRHEPFEIGSHGFRHEKITSLNALDAYRELADSKTELEKQLDVDINIFAFTYGITTPGAANLARKAGYTFAVNTDTGGLHLEENPYAIFRTPIFPEDKEPQLRKKTSSWYRKYFFLKRGK